MEVYAGALHGDYINLRNLILIPGLDTALNVADSFTITFIKTLGARGSQPRSCHASWSTHVCAPVQVFGLVLPWFGPVCGLFVVSPIVELGITTERWLTKDSQCFSENVNVCNTTATYQYYFWNLTNHNEVHPTSSLTSPPPPISSSCPTFASHELKWHDKRISCMVSDSVRHTKSATTLKASNRAPVRRLYKLISLLRICVVYGWHCTSCI